MIFPIGDEQVRGGKRPLFSYLLIAINVLLFLYVLQLSDREQAAFYNFYGAIPREITQLEDVFSVLTSMFLHGGIMHLAGNMLFLWVFADNIEATIGTAKFTFFYILGGFIAAYGHAATDMSSSVPMIGASGAISAVLGAYLVMFPKSKIKILFFVFIFRISAIFFLGFWIFQQFQSGFASLNSSGEGGVAWWAHIGGFIFGVISGLYFRFVNPKIQFGQDYQIID